MKHDITRALSTALLISLATACVDDAPARGFFQRSAPASSSLLRPYGIIGRWTPRTDSG